MVALGWLYVVAVATVSLLLLTLAFMAHDIKKEHDDGI